MSTALEHAFKEKSTKLLILLPLRTIYFWTFQCETPCTMGKGYTIVISFHHIDYYIMQFDNC